MATVIAHDLHHTIRDICGNRTVTVECVDIPNEHNWGQHHPHHSTVRADARRFVAAHMPGWEVNAYLGPEYYRLDGYSVHAKRFSLVDMRPPQ